MFTEESEALDAQVELEVELEELRRLAQERVETTSLRQVARDIGMSASGLMTFIEGSRPYPKTKGRLRKTANGVTQRFIYDGHHGARPTGGIRRHRTRDGRLL